MTRVAGGGRQIDAAAAFASENPLLIAGVAVVLFALLGAGIWLHRYLNRTPGERLRRTLTDYDRIAVLMHPNPDPDAMASALAVNQLIAGTETSASLQYPGEIRRPENRAFQTVLDLAFEHIETVEDIDEEAVVLVDHNTARGFPGAEEVEPVAVIDHHPGNGSGNEFTDIRSDYGACATIFASYFNQLEFEFSDTGESIDIDAAPAETIPCALATGLMYGIQSDTRSLTNGCESEDFAAAAFLYEGMDSDLLNRIANPQVDAEVLDVKSRAIGKREVRAPYAFSDVGEVSNTDAIPQAADELETLEGVSAVVVVGEKEGTMRIAGRSRDDRVHIGRAIEAVVDNIPMAEGGGHARMGGGKVPIKHMAGLGPSDGVSREDFRERVFDAMSGEL
ncbi:bifunctional oligoribonuclease/PAP phosphatase NrnA [Haloarcula rubripromontorii]|uniref:Bifunctional oligoribonuclease/PAP phosphatase NrnA n=1 Tax=Haloarcula rubripromontorii TaxID=1705562 RepID=A0A847TYR0_9EURY|nr:DHH family phosphoesterase [Haloarcula rubripromontorii]NLV05666.1 bifunctional oligoribonuclease/PAP phosphatase NrnA [Haloarcula rubripromontorii]